jgi:hypothetical protein
MYIGYSKVTLYLYYYCVSICVYVHTWFPRLERSSVSSHASHLLLHSFSNCQYTMSKQDRLYFFRVTLCKNIFARARLIVKKWLFMLTVVANRLKCYTTKIVISSLLTSYESSSSSLPLSTYVTDNTKLI